MALELARADERNAHICGQADLGAFDILAGEGRESSTVDHGVAPVVGSGSAVGEPERSVL